MLSQSRKFKLKLFSIVFTLAVLTIGLIIFGSVTQPPTLSRQAADTYIDFNEGHGTTVSETVSSAVSGTITNAVWKPEALCLSGKCLFFDGSGDYVSFGDDADYDFAAANNFTISVWIRHAPKTSGTDVIIAKTNASAGYKLQMESDGDITFAIDDDATWDPDAVVTSTAATYDDNRWHHIAAVKTGTAKIELYIDALLVGTNASISGVGDLTNSASFYVGIDGDGSSNPFTGFIDELKVYTATAQTQAQVNSDSVRGSPSGGVSASFGPDQSYLSEGLVGYWKMDESSTGVGTVSRVDSSGNAYDLIDNSPYAASIGGKFGNSTQLVAANSEYLSIADNAQLSAGNIDFTITTWAYLDTTTSGMHILSKGNTSGGDSTDAEYRLVIDSSARAELIVGDGTSQVNLSATNFGALSTSTWYFITAWFNSKTHTIGIQVNANIPNTTTVASAGINDTAGAFRVGSSRTGGNFWDGRVDELRFYKRLLSPAEVQALYNWAPGPLMYWSLDEGSGQDFYDLSGNDYDGNLGDAGTVESTDPVWTAGKFGKALKFDGSDDFAESTSTPTFNSTDNFSYELWFYDNDTGETYGTLISHNGNCCTNQFVAWEANAANTLRIQGNSDTWAQTDTNYTSKRWNHLALTRENGSVKKYFNGVLTSTVTGNTTAIGNSTPIRIGGVDTSGNDFGGIIDEVKIYNYARTPAQIIEDMNAGHPAPGSPVGSALGYWKFDGGYGDTAYNTGNGGSALNGNLAGATSCPQSGDSACPSWTNSGKFGKALDFDISATTDDYVEIASESSFDFTTQMTLSAWINKSTVSLPAFGAVVSKYGANGNLSYYTYVNNSEGICFRGDDDGFAPMDVEICTANSYINNNEWVHIVLTYDGSYVRLYINGREANSGSFPYAWSGILFNSSAALRIGGTVQGVDYFDGQIDEVKIYNFALTADQVKTEFNQGKASVFSAVSTESTGTSSFSSSRSYCVPGDTTTCNPPVAEWKFDENTGTTANDSAGNGNTGTLTNNPAWVSGKIGSGLSFDGGSTADDYVTAGSNTVIDNIFDAGGTVTFWVKPSGAGENNAGQYVSKYNTSDSGWLIRNEACDSNTLDLSMLVDHTTNGQFRKNCILNINSWNFVAVTYDDDSPAISPVFYVNGIRQTLDTETAPSGYGSDDTRTLYFGNGYQGNATMDGVIDQIRFYDYTRTPAQIAWEYNRGAPIAWYRFDEGTGSTAYNAAVNANDEAAGMNGTLNIGGSGSQTTTTQAWSNGAGGEINGSLNFDGTDDYVSVPDPGTNSVLDFNTGNSISISAWIKPATLPSSGNSYVILTKGSVDNTDDSNYSLSIENNSGTYRISFLYVRSGFGGSGGYDVYSTTSTPLTANSWQHIFLKYTFGTGNSISLYHNGILQTGAWDVCGGCGGTAAPSVTNKSLWIGAVDLNDGSSGPQVVFNGSIDDVRIFNYALTPQQISTLNVGGAVNFRN